MATLTKEQYAQLKGQGKKNFIPSGTGEQTIIEADKFVGALQGNADTATRLRDPITISLGGDAEGSAQFAGSSFRLDATIREAEHSVNSDVAENAKHSAQASHADLANIATLALRSMLADNASHAEEASHADDSTHADSSDVSTLATRALHADDAYHADEADNATYALKDSNGDNIHNTFVDKQSQITTNTNNIATHEGTLTNHEGRISQAESDISSLDTRVSDIEISTDVGRITQRIVNIEAKDVEQDGRLDAIKALKKIIHIPSYQRENDFIVSDKLQITISPNLSIKVNNKYYHNDASVLLDISNADNWDSTDTIDYTINTNRAGKDLYIYAVEHEDNFCKLILSANSTVPTGYTADTSRKIGGFHCLCNSVEAGKVWYDFVTKTDIAHPLAGYVTGDILPYSIWDLLHRSNSENEGMVFDPDTKLWWDIYLESWSGALPQSKYGAVHMTGISTYPAHGEKFAELASLVHKRLPDRDDFICVAKGSNENTNITGSTDQITVGGHVDTSSRRMISNIGLEECCGYLWQWVRTSNANGSSNWQSTTYASSIDGAKSYGSSYGAFYRALVGGSWGDGSNCGSLCVYVHAVSAYVGGALGSRFCAKERVINFI